MAWPLTRIGCTVGFKLLLSTNVTLANTPWGHAHPTNTIWLQMVLAAGSMLWKHWTFWKPGKANPNYNLMGEKKGFIGSRSQRVNCDPQVPRPCPPNITSQNRQGEQDGRKLQVRFYLKKTAAGSLDPCSLVSPEKPTSQHAMLAKRVQLSTEWGYKQTSPSSMARGITLSTYSGTLRF